MLDAELQKVFLKRDIIIYNKIIIKLKGTDVMLVPFFLIKIGTFTSLFHP